MSPSYFAAKACCCAQLDVSFNGLTGTDGEAALREAVQDKEGFNLKMYEEF